MRFFSKLAVVTFGGAYAVLAYMGQDVVQNSGWLTAGEMMDGLGLAETTPGPLILVTQFVGFMAAYKADGLLFGVSAAVVTLWATFVPCFLWIFAGAPYIDWISTRPRLKGALNAITAAVVGVILNLSIWFAIHVFFDTVETRSFGIITTSVPEWASLDWRVVVLTVAAALCLFRLHWGIPKMLLGNGPGRPCVEPVLIPFGRYWLTPSSARRSKQFSSAASISRSVSSRSRRFCSSFCRFSPIRAIISWICPSSPDGAL